MEENEQIAIQVTNELIDSGKFLNAEAYANNIVTAIKEGHVDPLKAYTVIKRMGKIVELVKDNEEIKTIALNELEKHLSVKQKSVNFFGARICKAATYTWYDFSGCEHDVLNELYFIKKQVEIHIKAIEDDLKKMIPSETNQAKVEFGIESDTQQIVMREFPKFIWEGYGVIKNVKYPKKIQKIGMKFMQI